MKTSLLAIPFSLGLALVACASSSSSSSSDGGSGGGATCGSDSNNIAVECSSDHNKKMHECCNKLSFVCFYFTDSGKQSTTFSETDATAAIAANNAICAQF